MIPCTFEAFMSGDRWHTWVSSSGQHHRIDYIAVPALWATRPMRAGVSEDVDLSLKKVEKEAADDHALVFLEAFAPCAFEAMPVSRRAACCQRFLFQDPARIAAFVADLAVTQLQPWRLNTTEHLAGLVSHIGSLLRRHFSAPGAAPRKPWMSPGT